jgi:hypothetical protein
MPWKVSWFGVTTSTVADTKLKFWFRLQQHHLIYYLILRAKKSFRTLSSPYRARVVFRDLKMFVKGFNTCECVSHSNDYSVTNIKQIKLNSILTKGFFTTLKIAYSRNSVIAVTSFSEIPGNFKLFFIS